MDHPLIWQILLGVLAIAAIVLGIYSARTWRAWDIVAGYLLFFTAIAFVILLSLSLKTRRQWLGEVARLQSSLQRLTDEQNLVLYGNPLEVPQTTPSLRSERARLSRLLIDRGRVWRDCVPGAADPAAGTIPVTITADGTVPHQIKPKMVLYVFREQQMPEGSPVAPALKVPIAFVGEMVVTAATDTAISLQPIRPWRTPLDADKMAQLSVANASWSLYEKMPNDSHEAFTSDQTGANLIAEGEPIFGAVNEAELNQVFQLVQQNLPPAQQLPADRLAALLQKFLHDGQRATNTDPPEAVQLKVVFNKQYEVQVDPTSATPAEGEAAPAAAEAGPRKFTRYFDTNGLAESPLLQRADGDSVTIQPNTRAVLPSSIANQLIREEVCTLVEPVYVRPLTDFNVALTSYFDRIVQTQKQIQAVSYNMATLEASKAQVDQITIYRQQERTKVESDLAKVRYEAEQVTKLVDTVKQSRDELRQRMIGLYNDNLRLAEYLAAAQNELAEQIERRVAEATSTSAPAP